jgi:uncharacterized alkaline shock family protein YloU
MGTRRTDPAGAGWYRSTRFPARSRERWPRPRTTGCRAREEDVARVTADPMPGRSLVSKRAIRELVRAAVLSVYGVSGFADGGPVGRLLQRLGLAHPGLHLEVEPELKIDLSLTVAYGLPIAEVARQVEASVRYTLRHALEREPDRVSIRIGKLRHEHGLAPAPEPVHDGAPRPGDLADSGTDVA